MLRWQKAINRTSDRNFFVVSSREPVSFRRDRRVGGLPRRFLSKRENISGSGAQLGNEGVFDLNSPGVGGLLRHGSGLAGSADRGPPTSVRRCRIGRKMWSPVSYVVGIEQTAVPISGRWQQCRRQEKCSLRSDAAL